MGSIDPAGWNCSRSARAWANKSIGQRVAFNDQKRQFIYQIIDELEGQFGAVQ